jgi:DNA polymerase-3 subunit epsilon|tara:strand:+ start:3716 stop:4348 length:633 start_codon:yes stop_codon:yes gene_type:complete
MMIKRRLRRIKDVWKVRQIQSPWSPLFQRYHGQELVSLDIETTSLDVSKAQILSIGAVVIKGNRVLSSDKLSLTLLAPKDWPQDSVKVHKLRRIDLNQGLPVAEALEKMLKFIGNRPIVGYNIGYDLAVLDKYARPLFDFGIPNPSVDVMDLYRKKSQLSGGIDCQMNLSFDAIAKGLDVPVLGRHTALGDAITTAIIYVRLKCSASLLK